MNVVSRTSSALAFCLVSALMVLGSGCGPNLSTEGDNCRALLDCENKCQIDDEECVQDCRDDASERAKARRDAIESCSEKNCADAEFQNSSACFVKHCHDEVATCAPDYYGDATCADIFRCELGYGDNCTEQGSKSAKLTHADLSLCWSEHDCESHACLVQNCTDLATKCGITGESTCRQANVCAKSAQAGESQWRCLENVAPGESAESMSALRKCQRSECAEAESLPEGILCTSKNCRTERANCGLNGSQTTCAEMWSCMSEQDDTCANAEDPKKKLFEDYIYEGPAEEQTAFFELDVCVRKNCPAEEPECVQNECGEELTACGV